MPRKVDLITFYSHSAEISLQTALLLVLLAELFCDQGVNNMLSLYSVPTKTLEALTQASQDLFAIFDSKDRLIYGNASFCNAFHTCHLSKPKWSEMMRANFQNQRGPVIESNDIDIWLAEAASRRGASPYRSFEIELHDRRWIFITETMSPDGHMLTYATDFSNVHSDTRTLREERNEARRRAQTDELTGLPNRRFTFEQISLWLVSNKNQNYRHSLALLDLDSFKVINDDYGHHVGDKILEDFSRRIQSFTRLNDIFGRIGGEEFLVFLPGCSLEIAGERLNKIRTKVALTQPLAKHPEINLTFSAGLIELQSGETLKSALLRADTLLYRAKAAGRNRVEY